MSKHKEKTPAPLADWEVAIIRDRYSPAGTHAITQARWKRTAPGWYTFTDEQGVVAEFPPGVVLSVLRKEPPVVVHPPGDAGLDAVKELGRNLAGRGAGPEILPVAPHGGK